MELGFASQNVEDAMGRLMTDAQEVHAEQVHNSFNLQEQGQPMLV